MVIEYADGGTLCEHLQKHFSELTWKDKYKMALGVTDGLMYLHKLKIVYKGLVCINTHDRHIVNIYGNHNLVY